MGKMLDTMGLNYQEILKKEKDFFNGQEPQAFIDTITASLEPMPYKVTVERAPDFYYAVKNNLELPYILIISYTITEESEIIHYEVKRSLYADVNDSAYVQILTDTQSIYYEIPTEFAKLGKHQDIIIDMVQQLVIYTQRKNA